MKERRHHRALSSATFAVLLWLLPTAIRAQVAAAPSPAPATNQEADDPFAVLAAKAEQPEPNPGETFLVLRPDGSPATDAIVVFTAIGDDDAAREAWRRRERQARATFPADLPRRLALLHADGARYPIDQRGTTRVPKDGHLLVFAGELLAVRTLQADRREPRLRLRLAPPHACTIEVATAGGEPAVGVPVALRRAANGETEAIAPTGADGTLALRLLPDDAAAGIALDVVARTKLDTALPPTGGRVRFVLPPTTPMSATFVGDVAPGSELRFALQGDGEGRQIVGERIDERSARWPFVEVGAAATATVQSESLELVRTSIVLWDRGEPVALTRRAGEPVIALQLLDADGAPAVHRLVELEWRCNRVGVLARSRTNREGWIEVAVPPEHFGKPGLELFATLLASERGDRLATARIPLAHVAHRWTRLSSVRCAAEPFAANGRLTTPTGDPLPDFACRIFHRHWQELRTDAGGNFTVRGHSPYGSLLELPRAWCFVDGEPWQRRLPNGTKDVTIVVQRAALVRVGSELTGPVDSWFTYRLQPADGGRSFELPFSPADRELMIPPGRWNFLVMGHKEEVLRLTDLHGASGIETHDPRFMAFDWRAFATLVECRLRDPSGTPSDAGTIWVRDQGTSRRVWPRGGVVRLLLPKHGADIRIEPHDVSLAKSTLRAVTQDQDVVLGGVPVKVTLQPMPKLPPDAQLVLAIDDGDSVAFDANGVATAIAPTAGSFEATIRLRKPRQYPEALDWQLPRIEVAKGGTQVEVPLTPARRRALDTAIAETEER